MEQQLKSMEEMLYYVRQCIYDNGNPKSKTRGEIQMFCSKCGAKLPDDAEFCPSCGREFKHVTTTTDNCAPYQQNIPNHLVWAILVTLCCCLPFGIVAIVYSTQVTTHLQAGNYEAARKASNAALTWILVSVIVGFLCGGGSLFFNFLPLMFL